MNNFNTPEISLRRAVILTGNKTPSELQTHAFEHLDLISQAQEMSQGLSNQLGMQKDNISLAIQGIRLAYQAWSTHTLKTSIARQQFVEEMQTQLSTFTLDFNLEEPELSTEAQAIHQYWRLINQECKGFIQYFGIQTQIPEDSRKITKLAVLPYFKMSQALQQKNLLPSLLERHQRAVFLFLKTDLPNRYYYQKYHQTSRLRLKLEPIWTGDNYLNRFRAPLLIIHSLANLLWNLQHPVDPAIGLALSCEESINLCVRAEMFINVILDEFDSSVFARVDSSKQTLKIYLLNIERYLKSLHAGFQDQSLHHINLQDVSNSMHRAARIMANKLFELLYQSEQAAEQFIATMMYLAELIMQQPQILKFMWPQAELPPIPGLNQSPMTLMDCLILLCHTPVTQRLKLYHQIQQQGQEVYQELYATLIKLEQLFLHPFEVLLSRHRPKTHSKILQEWIAQHFIALIALIMECFNLFPDTRSETASTPSLDDSTQRQQIMQIAATKDKDAYYRWSIALFLKKTSGSAREKLDELLAELNQMRMMTQLLDKLGHMVNENKMVLLDKDFQRTVIDILQKIREAYQQLNLRLNRVEDAMQQDELIQRNEKRILQPMLDDVEATLESIQKSISRVAEIINHPKFSERQQQALLSQMHDIHRQFDAIFPSSIPFDSFPMMRMQVLATDATEDLSREKLALLQLVDICYQQMSMLSKYHPKGQALLELKQSIQKQSDYGHDELKTDFLKLIELTASPRSTTFFQAPYGQTRSAKALITTLLDPQFKYRRCFLACLFAQNAQAIPVNQSLLLEKIQQLQRQHGWPHLAREI